MVFIGVAVGLGNVWRFPYMAGAFGGGAFLLVYIVLLVGFGIPALMAELTLGRMTRRGPLGAFASIGMPGGRVVGWLLFVTVLMATSYYTVIVGWVLRYLLASLRGAIGTVDPQALFDDTTAGVGGQLGATAIVFALTAVVLLLGIRRGVERISTIGMPLLFVLLIVLIVRSVTLPGAMVGVRQYLVPDFERIDIGVVTAALGQVFFSLSLGGTFLLTYASYLPKRANLKASAISVGVGETLAAVLAGLVIIPAAVAFGLELSSGPPLTFVTVPSIFARTPAGGVFATTFFALLFFAAFLSVVAAVEVLVATMTEQLGWSRSTSVLVLCTVELVLAIVPTLSVDYILRSDLVWGSTMQPLGSAMVMLGLAWVVGLRRALGEANEGNEGRPLGTVWFFWIKYVIPLGIAVILALGLKDLFAAFGE
jgi:NSS family neurotransmitter:Na+ symporter